MLRSQSFKPWLPVLIAVVSLQSVESFGEDPMFGKKISDDEIARIVERFFQSETDYEGERRFRDAGMTVRFNRNGAGVSFV